jgi:hypothetical protein
MKEWIDWNKLINILLYIEPIAYICAMGFFVIIQPFFREKARVWASVGIIRKNFGQIRGILKRFCRFDDRR